MTVMVAPEVPDYMPVLFVEEPVAPDGLPRFLAEFEVIGDPDLCLHNEGTYEAGTGMEPGRFSIGREYVQERCVTCDEQVGGYWASGVM